MNHKRRQRRWIALCIVITLMSPLLATPNRDSVNLFDRWAMFPYSKPLTTTSDVTQYLSFLSPALFAAVAPSSDWLEIALLYGASSGLSFGTRALLKSTLERIRPYEYFSTSLDYPPSLEDYNQSFPSGHTIMAFNGASFTHMLFALRYPESPYRLPVTIAAWTFATTTAVLRVASGNHFISDVLAGAAIGSFFGIAIPLLAWKFLPSWQHENIQVMLGPSMMAINIKL